MKMLVTGGMGFIGTNLVKELVKYGHEVIVIDDMTSTMKVRYEIVKGVQYFANDVSDYKAIRPKFDGVDYVFHMAAESRIPPCINRPLDAVNSNVLGTATVLQCAREAGVKRVIYSSSSAIYGNTDVAPQHEGLPPDPLNPYSVTKLCGEYLCKTYTDLFGLKTVILRYFNVYGPGEPQIGEFPPVIGAFLAAREQGEPIVVTGTGMQSRDFVHVDDVVEANFAAAISDIDEKYFGTPINIGTGQTHTILKLAQLVAKERSDIILISSREGEAKLTQADISLAQKVLGWTPKKDIEDYIGQQTELI
jgi:UDP-glucose 4-epimerase